MQSSSYSSACPVHPVESPVREVSLEYGMGASDPDFRVDHDNTTENQS